MSSYFGSPAWIINDLNFQYWLSFLQIQDLQYPKGYSGQNRRQCIVSDTRTTPINYLLAAHRQPSLVSWMTVHWFTAQKIPDTVLNCIMFNKDGPARSVSRSQNCQWGLQHSCQNKLSLQSSCWNSQKVKFYEKKVVFFFFALYKNTIGCTDNLISMECRQFLFFQVETGQWYFPKKESSKKGRVQVSQILLFLAGLTDVWKAIFIKRHIWSRCY